MNNLNELYKYIHILIHGSNVCLASKIGIDIFIFSILFTILYVTPFVIWHYFYTTYDVTNNLVKLLVVYFNILIKIIKKFISLIYIHMYVLIVAMVAIILWLTSIYLDPFNEYSLDKTYISQSSIITDANNNVIDYIFDDTIRIWAPMDKIDPKVVSLVLFSEDDKFYEHSGFDIAEIFVSIKKNFHRKKYARGASTITQQLAKNAFLTKEKTIKRKLREIALSLKLESNLSKDEIIKMYLNLVEWGPGIYGIEAASRYYFDKSAESLSLAQCYFLALILPNPKLFSPFYNPLNMRKIRTRQVSLAKRLYSENQITFEEKEKQQNMRFWFYANRNPKNLSSNYPKLDSVNIDDKIVIFSGLENYLIKKFGKTMLYHGGMLIQLSIDKKKQENIMDVSAKINKQSDYDNSNLNFIPIYLNNKVIAFAQLVDTSTDNIKKLMSSLANGEKLGKIYKLNEIPWKTVIQSTNRLPVVSLKK